MRKNIIVLSLLSLAFSASSFNCKSVDKPKQNNSNLYSDTSIPIINNSENQTISDKVLEDIGGDKKFRKLLFLKHLIKKLILLLS